MEPPQSCRICGETSEQFLGIFRPIELQDGVCFNCWRYQENIPLDYRDPLQRYLDTLAEIDDVARSSIMETPLLTTREAAGYLKVNMATLQRWAYAGKIASVKMGDKPRSPRRFRLADLDAFIAAHTKPAETKDEG